MPAKKVAAKTAKAHSPRRRLVLTILGVVVAIAGLAVTVENRLASPDIKLLVPSHGARWIRQNRPFQLTGFGPTQEVVFFRKRVTVPAGMKSCTVTVQALRACVVYWDKRPVLGPTRPEEWKQPREVVLNDLTSGEHDFEVFVEDSLGPAALLVYADGLGLRSGSGWEESLLGEKWERAALADDAAPPPLAQAFSSPLRALANSLWWLVPLFAATWAFLLWSTRSEAGRGLPKWCTASRCRWAVIAAWAVLAANNFLKLPAEMGYDLPSHVDYIRFIAERGELPDARDGLQMFQTPLFYAIVAVAYRGLTLFLASGAALLWLRWLTLLCGIAQVEICFRAGRLVFPDRDDLQMLAVLIGGLLPMNVYMSQTLGNEPLCGVLSALILLWGWQTLREPDAAIVRRQWIAGVLFGLDLLSKMTALLLTPVIAGVLVVANRLRGFGGVLLAFARTFGAAAVVAGWYYGRNWIRFGKPLVGGWDPVRGIQWWQDPGYRTPWQMVSFGRSLFSPLHAGFYSLADGFYASLWLDGNLSGMDSPPPWNMTLMLAAPWPALLLSAAVAAGLVRAVWCRDKALRHSLQLAGVTLLLYLAAFVLLWLEVPAFSQAKASYTLGLTPAYALLCVAGLDLLPVQRFVRAAVFAFVLCWSVLVYGAYFVM
jgi:hypothetical protein